MCICVMALGDKNQQAWKDTDVSHAVRHVMIIIRAIWLKQICQGLGGSRSLVFAYWGLKGEAIRVKRNKYGEARALQGLTDNESCL